MIKRKHWFVAIPAALCVHAAGLAAISVSPAEGARSDGLNGIEIDIGLLGDLGEDTNTATAAAAPPPPRPQTPAPKTPAPVHTPPPRQAPVLKVKQDQPAPAQELPPVEPQPAPAPTIPPSQQPTASTLPPNRNVPSDAAHNGSTDSTARSTGAGEAHTSGGHTGARPSYYARIAAAFAAHKKYPLSARRQKQEGVVTLFFVVQRSGQITDYRIKESSGHAKLDAAVLKMVKDTHVLPPFPSDMTESQLEVTFPISFNLDRDR